MAVISVTILLSSEQVVAGIPRTVGITTNVPATIFYTLDGSIPSLFSMVYTGPIQMPVNQLSVTLNILATNGVDSTPIISETFITNMAEGTNARLPHSSSDALGQSNIPDLYPFGTNGPQPNQAFLNPADASITVDNPALPSTPTGFDGAGGPTGFTNQPYDLTNYSIKYSTTDAQGQTGYGIGNLPAAVKVIPESTPPDETSINSNMFDPRAFVIFQDASKENPSDPPHINRMHFSLENPEKTRDGNLYFNSGLDAPPVSGTFLRSHYNPRTNSITYYYLDTWTNKWIISTAPYNPSGPWTGNLSGQAVAGGSAGAKYVF
jgi:hypothetical protein